MFYFICVCVRTSMFVYVCALLCERQRTTLGNPFSPFILFCTRVFCVSASLRTQDELALKLLGKLISPLQSQKECRGYGCTWLHLASCACPGAWTQVITLAWQVHLPSESGPELCEVLSRAQRIWKRMLGWWDVTLPQLPAVKTHLQTSSIESTMPQPCVVWEGLLYYFLPWPMLPQQGTG